MQWNNLFAAIIALGFMSSAALADVYITVSLSEQEMTVRADGYEGMARWDVSTGRRGLKTPTGYFQPQWTTRMHYSRKYNNAPMPHSIFFHGGYAIHGTDHVNQLGKPASHGCIRLHPENAEMLFGIVKEAGMKNTHINIVP
jgi:lipoprotein-anchoring transpeptidase ErfK/SrfK